MSLLDAKRRCALAFLVKEHLQSLRDSPFRDYLIELVGYDLEQATQPVIPSAEEIYQSPLMQDLFEALDRRQVERLEAAQTDVQSAVGQLRQTLADLAGSHQEQAFSDDGFPMPSGDDPPLRWRTCDCANEEQCEDALTQRLREEREEEAPLTAKTPHLDEMLMLDNPPVPPSAEVDPEPGDFVPGSEEAIREARRYILTQIESHQGITVAIVARLTGYDHSTVRRFITAIQDELQALARKRNARNAYTQTGQDLAAQRLLDAIAALDTPDDVADDADEEIETSVSVDDNPLPPLPPPAKHRRKMPELTEEQKQRRAENMRRVQAEAQAAKRKAALQTA